MKVNTGMPFVIVVVKWSFWDGLSVVVVSILVDACGPCIPNARSMASNMTRSGIMANANPTFTSNVNASVRRQRQPMDNLGAVPSISFDPQNLRIQTIAEHGDLGGPIRHWTVRQAVDKRLIEVVPYGHNQIVFIKASRVHVELGPSENLMKLAYSKPSPAA
ncbi:hypothetical protein [uncultured Desulfosarcina sp.]|uniref:hypothetical protein n=1 Tax=uncultured Desulfosarcina sp. TaxID=218289 RepID=UPI003749241F